jgi:hypothetical protein
MAEIGNKQEACRDKKKDWVSWQESMDILPGNERLLVLIGNASVIMVMVTPYLNKVPRSGNNLKVIGKMWLLVKHD